MILNHRSVNVKSISRLLIAVVIGEYPFFISEGERRLDASELIIAHHGVSEFLARAIKHRRGLKIAAAQESVKAPLIHAPSSALAAAVRGGAEEAAICPAQDRHVMDAGAFCGLCDGNQFPLHAP